MEYKKFGDSYIVRLEKGEEVIECIKNICKNENIQLGEITGLGASNLVEIGLFNVNTKEYKTKTFEGMFEITSLIGNITTKGEEKYLHTHINFGDEDGNAKGGHLVKCIISATAEIIINKLDGKVDRFLDKNIRIKFNQILRRNGKRQSRY